MRTYTEESGAVLRELDRKQVDEVERFPLEKISTGFLVFVNMRRGHTEVRAMAAWEMTELRVSGALPAALGPHSACPAHS